MGTVKAFCHPPKVGHWSKIKMDSGEPCWISISQQGVLIKKSTLGLFGKVIIDLRPNSPTFKKWNGFELNSKNYRQLYVPKGFAHGFQSLEDDSEVFYLVSEYHNSISETGIRWNDPVFKINWPLKPTKISKKDESWPNFTSS